MLGGGGWLADCKDSGVTLHGATGGDSGGTQMQLGRVAGLGWLTPVQGPAGWTFPFCSVLKWAPGLGEGAGLA